MKTTRTTTLTVDHGDSLTISGVRIGEAEHALEIVDNRWFRLLFDGGEFEVVVREGMLNFERQVHRPNHDHGDHEWLVCREAIPGRFELRWSTEGPRDGWELFGVRFGAVTVGY